MGTNSKKIAYYGLATALAIIMGYIEFLIPMPIPVPGVKLGLSNIVVLLILYIMGTRAAFVISLLRVLLSGLLFAGFAGLLYSLAGAILSFTFMAVLKRTNQFSIIGISLVGGVVHNVGQITIAALVVENSKLFYYLPMLLVAGVITGVVIGIVAKLALKHLSHAL